MIKCNKLAKMSGKQTSSESCFAKEKGEGPMRQKKSLRLLRKRKLHVGRLTTVFKLADIVAELELWGRRVDNCWRLNLRKTLILLSLYTVVYAIRRCMWCTLLSIIIKITLFNRAASFHALTKSLASFKPLTCSHAQCPFCFIVKKIVNNP